MSNSWIKVQCCPVPDLSNPVPDLCSTVPDLFLTCSCPVPVLFLTCVALFLCSPVPEPDLPSPVTDLSSSAPDLPCYVLDTVLESPKPEGARAVVVDYSTFSQGASSLKYLCLTPIGRGPQMIPVPVHT